MELRPKERKEETNLLMDWDLPKPQTDINQKTDVDVLALCKLQIGQNDPTEEQVDVTELLISPLTTKAPEKMAEKTDNDDLTKVEKRDQQEEKKYATYRRTYVVQLSEEEEGDAESDYSIYSYLG